jgi:glycosyltransferase involved in cell wall biosynthesis
MSEVPARPRVVLAAVGDPASIATWSGVTAGVFSGLRQLGVQSEAMNLRLPGALETALLATAALPTRNRYDAEGATLTSAVRGALAARRVPHLAADGIVQIGTTYSLPGDVPFVTLEDMTLRQATAVHPVFSRMSAGAVERWERRRARIYARARMCCAASRWTAESLGRDYGIPADRIAVVGFGANHRAGAPERDWRVPRFLFVGIDWERKGGPQVLRAFARLREAHPDAVLDVVGGHPPLDLTGVNCHGVLSQARDGDRATIVDLFARATCFVMPSLVEPFGIVHAEAASAGIPSIVSSVGGPRDVIGADGGLVVEPGDEGALVEAMLRLCDPATARRMGAAARERSALYTWPKVAARLLRALGLAAPDERVLAEFL